MKKLKCSIVLFMLFMLAISVQADAKSPQALKTVWKQQNSGSQNVIISAGYTGIYSLTDKKWTVINDKTGKKLYSGYKRPASVWTTHLAPSGWTYFTKTDQNVFALDPKGKVKWKKAFKTSVQTTLHVANNGRVLIETIDKKGDASTREVDPKTGKTMTVFPSNSIIQWMAFGDNGYTFASFYGKDYQVYQNGKKKWTIKGSGERNFMDAAFSKQGNLAAATGRYSYDADTFQLFNKSGKQLLKRTNTDVTGSFGGVRFNNKGQLLYFYIKNSKFVTEWYDTKGKLLKKAVIKLPKLRKGEYRYANKVDGMVVNVTDKRDIFIRDGSHTILKYSQSGKLLAKTEFSVKDDVKIDENPAAGIIKSVYNSKASKSKRMTYEKYSYK